MCWNSKKLDPANVVFIAVIVVMMLIVAGSIWMYTTAYRYEVKCLDLDDKLIKNRESLYSEVIPPDSVFSAIIAVNEIQNPKEKDNCANAEIIKNKVGKYLIPLSEVLKIRESQKLLLMRQDQLTDDIQQETNNIINKMNGWLGFWMGVMAILGVFVPIALQLKLYRENIKNNEKYQEELELLQSYENKFDIAKRTVQADIKAEFLKIETEIDRQYIEMQNDCRREIDNMKGVKFTAIIKCFHNIMNSPEIRTNELRNQLIERNWEEIATNVRWFIEYYINHTTGVGDIYVMSVILIQVASVLKSLRLIIPRRKRQLEYLAAESYNIIQTLNSVPLNREVINCRLKNYQESLLNLHPMLF